MRLLWLCALSGVVAFCLGMWSCGSAPRLFLPPSSTATGQPRQRGPFGVGLWQASVQARITGAIAVEVMFPAMGDGRFDPKAKSAPVILFLQGGAVAVERYRWLTSHLASRGAVVLSPRHTLNAAIMQGANADIVLQAYRTWTQNPAHPFFEASKAKAPAIVMGHSLGGITGIKRHIASTRFRAAALFGSYVLPEDDMTVLKARPAHAMLLLTGALDGVIVNEKTKGAFTRAPTPAVLAIVGGMNHYDWCDDNSAAERATDNQATRPQIQTRNDALFVLDSWLAAVFLGRSMKALPSAQRRAISFSSK